MEPTAPPIGSPFDLRLSASEKVDETDIGLVKMDQPVRITVDAYKNRSFQGKVIRIAPMGVEKDNVTRFEVRVSILNDLDLLKANMSANAEIILEEHHNVLLIPESALIYNEKRETFVELPDVSAKTGRRQAPIKTGLGNGARTEVLSGLKLGELVDEFQPLVGRELVGTLLPRARAAVPARETARLRRLPEEQDRRLLEVHRHARSPLRPSWAGGVILSPPAAR